MKRLFLPLLAALALPTAVNAESYWLILIRDGSQGQALEKVQVESMDSCKEQGEKWDKSLGHRTYWCIIGK